MFEPNFVARMLIKLTFGVRSQALRQKRSAEESCEEFRCKINELQTINVNLTSVKSKLEQELVNLTSDYDEVTKELKVSRRGF